ncbi:MAG: DUF4440 domain-containing protein [Robiginitomaculum sp.]|nr:MAG: DUF4440 domain-containing protein [Robiginitomaculum sp.]
MKYIFLASLLVLVGACSNPVEQKTQHQNTKVPVQAIYAGFAAGDMAMVTSVMSPDIVWNEAEGNPYADKNPYEGPDAILSGLFARLGGEWINFTATPNEYVIEGNRVIVFGRYTANYRATGQALDAPFVHSWTLQDGKVVSFQQYTDTAEYAAVMTK